MFVLVPPFREVSNGCNHLSFDLGLLLPGEASSFPNAFQSYDDLLRIAHAVARIVRLPQMDSFSPIFSVRAVHQQVVLSELVEATGAFPFGRDIFS